MKRINLLPPEQRVKASRERGLLWAILILVAIVVALGLVYVWENNQVNDKQAQVDSLTAETAAVQQQALALAPYAVIQTTRTAMTQTAKGIYDSRVPWSTILQEVSLVIPDKVRLQGLTGTVPASMLPGSAAPAVPAGPAAATPDVTFTGTSYTHRDVAEFMTRLGLIPQLSNVQLASSTGAAATTDATGTTGTPTVTFTVTASLRPYLTPPPATVVQGAGQ
ncbi:MAG TPA: PilN domain-containing protein [Thermoleophilia bacterium]